MFCEKCGSKIDDKTGLCPICDKDRIKKKKRKKRRKIILSVFFVICACIVAFCGVYLCLNARNESNSLDVDLPETNLTGIQIFQSKEENKVISKESNTGYVNNEILIYLKSKEDENKLQEYISKIGGTIVGNIDSLDFYQVQLNKTHTREELNKMIQDLGQQSWVENAGLNLLSPSQSIEFYPNDKKFKYHWSYMPNGINWGLEAIHMPAVWEYRDQMNPVNVGICDNVLDMKHQDLRFMQEPLGNVDGWSSINFNEENTNHGTHVAGTMAANFNNKLGIPGIIPNAQLYGVSARGLESRNTDSIVNYIEAMTYLIENCHCKAINISMGCNDDLTFNASYGNQASIDFLKECSNTLQDALKKLMVHNQFVVCVSAGNGNDQTYYRKIAAYNDETELKFYSSSDYEKYKIIKDMSDDDIRNHDDYRDRAEHYIEVKNYFNANADNLKELQVTGGVDAKYNSFFTNIEDEELKNRIIVVGAIKNNVIHIVSPKFPIPPSFNFYTICNFSNRGERVDVVAPGYDIYSCFNENKYGKMPGTSMACPHVTGLAGILFSLDPDISADQVKKIIVETSVGNYDGAGLIDAKKAVERLIRENNIQIENKEEDKEDNKNDNDDKDDKTEEERPSVISQERDVVLVLDSSGSMSGKPLDETKVASNRFINEVMGEHANIGMVTYDEKVKDYHQISNDRSSLYDFIDSMESTGSTNIELGLKKAYSMLKKSSSQKKIIVLMSDGLPNYGKVGDELIEYAKQIKDSGIMIYTLGFFEDASASNADAKMLLQKIASDHCYFLVDSAENLKFFFEDIGDQVSGQKYILVKIECPVDVRVRYGDEVLSSSEINFNGRTSFGTLTVDTVEEDGISEKTKTLRLKEGKDYDIQIKGNDRGKMDYTIGFMNDEGEYDDLRHFNNIDITRRTKIDTVASTSSTSVLNIDKNGDGKYDSRMYASQNGRGKEYVPFELFMKESVLLRAIVLGFAVIVGVIKLFFSKKRTV